MFFRTRERRLAARASALRVHVEDTVQRLRSASDEISERFVLCARTTRQSLDEKFGQLEEVPSDAKTKIVEALLAEAKTAYSTDLGRSYALFLLGAYLDALTLEGSDAIFIRAMCASLLERTEPDASSIIDPIDAVLTGDLPALRRFIEANPRSLDAVYESRQWTLLHRLAGLGPNTLPVHCTMAAELIRAGADANCRTELGWTPLIIIAIQGHKESVPLIETLVAHGADVHAVAKDGFGWEIFWQHGMEVRVALEEASLTASSRGS